MNLIAQQRRINMTNHGGTVKWLGSAEGFCSLPLQAESFDLMVALALVAP